MIEMAQDFGKVTERYKKPQDKVAWCIISKNDPDTIYCPRKKARRA